MRNLWLALGLSLCSFGAFGQALPPLEGAARDALRAEIRAYLLENPEVIFEAIQILEAKRNAAAAQSDAEAVAALRDRLLDDGHSFVTGNPDGDVTVIEFSDYRCGYCKKAHPEIHALLERDPNVRLVVKEFPILGPESVTLARMALAALALDPARFAALNDTLMRHPGNLNETTGYRLAAEAGYDLAALKAAAASTEIDAKLQANAALAEQLGLQGTPSFVIGSEVIRGYLPVDELAAAVAATRAALN